MSEDLSPKGNMSPICLHRPIHQPIKSFFTDYVAMFTHEVSLRIEATCSEIISENGIASLRSSRIWHLRGPFGVKKGSSDPRSDTRTDSDCAWSEADCMQNRL